MYISFDVYDCGECTNTAARRLLLKRSPRPAFLLPSWPTSYQWQPFAALQSTSSARTLGDELIGRNIQPVHWTRPLQASPAIASSRRSFNHSLQCPPIPPRWHRIVVLGQQGFHQCIRCSPRPAGRKLSWKRNLGRTTGRGSSSTRRPRMCRLLPGESKPATAELRHPRCLDSDDKMHPAMECTSLPMPATCPRTRCACTDTRNAPPC